MNDQVLRDRLHDAVADVHPAGRLDEILASTPVAGVVDLTLVHGRRSRRSPRLFAVAAAILVIVGLAVALVVVSTEDGSTNLEIQSTSSTGPAGPTTGEPVDGPRVGDRISVLEAALPDGMSLIEEGPRRSDADLTLVTRYAESDGLWNGDGPYLRIVLQRDPGIGTTFLRGDQGEPDAVIDGHDAFRSVDEQTDPTSQPLPGDLAEFEHPWVTLAWATGPDELLSVQSVGVDQQVVLDIAYSVVVQP